MIADTIQIEIWKFLKSWGGGFLFAFMVFAIYLWKCEQINKYILLPVYKFLRNTCLWLNKNYIAKNIEINVNSSVRQLNDKLIGYNIDGVSIQWVKERDIQCLLRDNKVIIKMKKGDSQEENFVNVTHLLIKNSLLYKSKSILTEQQANYIELYTTKKICENQGVGVEKYFHDNFYLAEEKKDLKIKDYFGSFVKIDNSGLYISLFLQEILSYGERSSLKKYSEQVNKEIDGFILFLDKFVDRKHGENEIEKNFVGTYINFGIVLVADPKKRDEVGMYPYLKYIESLINMGIRNIYLLARGNNLNFLKDIKNHILSISHFLVLKNEQVMKTTISDVDGMWETSSAILWFENKKTFPVDEKIKVSDLK
jgi:hypothetical protein